MLLGEPISVSTGVTGCTSRGTEERELRLLPVQSNFKEFRLLPCTIRVVLFRSYRLDQLMHKKKDYVSLSSYFTLVMLICQFIIVCIFFLEFSVICTIISFLNYLRQDGREYWNGAGGRCLFRHGDYYPLNHTSCSSENLLQTGHSIVTLNFYPEKAPCGPARSSKNLAALGVQMASALVDGGIAAPVSIAAAVTSLPLSGHKAGSVLAALERWRPTLTENCPIKKKAPALAVPCKSRRFLSKFCNIKPPVLLHLILFIAQKPLSLE